MSALLASKAWAQSEAAAKPMKIGVLDLRRLMDNCQLRKDKEVEINKMKDEEAAKLKEEKKALDELKAGIDRLPKDAPDLAEKAKELTRKQEALLLKNRWAEADVLETWEKTFQSVYSDVLRMIEDFREKNNYDLILRYDSQPLGAGGARVIDQLDRKVVMARAASVDVTDALIKYVNETYAQEKKK
jgi:Skp family chaperone for outer membrane proteins